MKGLHLCFYTLISIICLISCETSGKKRHHENTKTGLQDSIEVKFQLVTGNIKTPVELDESPDDTHRKFITDNSGKIWILKNDTLLAKPFFNIYDKLGKQNKKSLIGTLFSMAFHPQYSKNRKFYVCYNAPTAIKGNGCKLVVSEFTADKFNPDGADLSSERRIIQVEGKSIKSNGAQIAFGPDGYLYISIGDDKGGDTAYKFLAQDLSVLNGKLLRIDVSKLPYTIPADNPFVATKNARPEIWAYGFRKLWRYSFDTVSHQLIGGDVGEDREEEIDIVEKGGNYGWPIREGDSSFEKGRLNNISRYEPPISTYTHKVGICIIGGGFYYGKEIPLLKNKYVFGDFNGNLFALEKNTGGTWIRQPLKILNKPKGPFLICGCNIDENNEIFVMGFLNAKTGLKGVVYKIEKI